MKEMMKKIRSTAALLLTAALVLALFGCSKAPEKKEEEKEKTESSTPDNVSSSVPENSGTDDPAESGGKDILVIFFSRTGEQYKVGVIDEGNTAIVAKMIAEKTDADMFEVIPADDHYPMTYSELTDVAKQEQKENARPEYAGEVPDLSQYSTIFIGAPVWWGDWPMIMYTFFENNSDALSGKTLIPFSTHEGSGLSGFDKKLASACLDSTVGKGIAIRGSDCQDRKDDVGNTLDGWLSELSHGDK